MKIINKGIALLISTFILCGVISLSVFAAAGPKNPSKLKASSVKADSVVLSWKKVDTAEFYRLYVKRDGKWKAVADTKETKYTVKKLTASKTYSFAVKSAKKSGDKNLYSENYTTVNVKTGALQANSLTATAGVRTVKLKWSKAPGASGYTVYQRIDGKWKAIKSLSSSKLSFTVSDLKADTAYRFVIRPYTSGDVKKVNGPVSNTVKVKTYKPNKVTVESSSATASSAKLTWSKAADASGYRVYRYVDGEWKTYKTLDSRKALSLTLTNLKSDSTYKFRVRPYLKNGSAAIWFDFSDTCTVTTDPTKKNLKVYRTKNLKKIISGNSFTLSYVTDNKEYGKVPVTVAKKGNNYHLYTKVNEVQYYLMNLASGNYIVLKRQKAYVQVPDSLKKTVSVKTSVDALVPEFDGKGKATIATFDGQKTVCETFSNKAKTRILRYYYRGGSLIGLEECNSKGALIERASVKSISDTSKASLFKIPSGYKKISYSSAKIS